MPPSASFSLADRICRRLGILPVFAHHAPPPVWRHFKTFLLVGWSLRMLAALSNDWIFRLDEIWEYLEQAHRLVFGYGVVPWEYRIGARNWLLSLPAAAVLASCKLLGFSHPDYYVSAVKIMNVFFSLAIPIGVYFFTRRHFAESAARAAFVFSCLWWEFFVFAPHTLPSLYVTAIVFAALALFYPGAGAGKIFLCGFLLGLAAALRLPYVPVIGALGLLLLLTLPAKKMALFAVGGVAAFIVAGFSDYLFWGDWWESYWNYVLFSWLRVADFSEQVNHWDGIIKLTNNSFGLFPALFVFALLQWRRLWLPLVMSFFVLPLHFLLHVHYSYLFLAVSFFSLLFGAASHLLPRIKVAAAVYCLAVSCAAVMGFLPGMQDSFAYPSRYLFYEDAHLSAMKYLARRPKGEVKAVAWINVNPWLTGSYYYFHRAAPLYYFGYDYDVPHRKLVEESGFPPSKLYSHIVLFDIQFQPQQRALAEEGFVAVKQFDLAYGKEGGNNLVILRNINGRVIHLPEKFMLDKPSLSDENIDQTTWLEVRPPVFLPLDADLPRYPADLTCMPPLPCDKVSSQRR